MEPTLTIMEDMVNEMVPDPREALNGTMIDPEIEIETETEIEIADHAETVPGTEETEIEEAETEIEIGIATADVEVVIEKERGMITDDQAEEAEVHAKAADTAVVAETAQLFLCI
jgi:hypothetical protein